MSGPEVVAGVGLIVALATWLFLGVLALHTRARTPRAGPSTMELGDEPPAVVDLLTDGFEPTAEAIPATLLDLAARRWVEIDQYGDNVVIRIRRAGKGELRPFERQVLDHLRDLAVDGVVPAGALTTGTEAAATRWSRRFRKAVIEDARAAGLCRPRWAGISIAVVWAGAVLAFACAWGADQLAGDSSDLRALDVLTVAGGGAGMALAAVALAITSSDRQRETERGLDAGGRWLGVRRYLADHGEFATKPAAAVVLWDRYLAYAVALDLAPLAVAQLPLGAEDDRHAWSRAGGQWRHVVVGYPRFRPGYGQHPLLACAGGLATACLSVVAIVWLAPVAAGTADWVEDLGSQFETWARWVAGAVLVLLVFGAGWSALKLLYGVGDVLTASTTEGLLVRSRLRETGDWLPGPLRFLQPEPEKRRRRYFLAVDNGTTEHLRAWRVRPDRYRAASQGATVRVVVTPRLGYVRSVEPLAGLAGSAADLAARADDAELVSAAQALVATHDN